MKEKESLGAEPVRRIAPISWWWAASALAFGLFLGIGMLLLTRNLVRPIEMIFIAISIAAALVPIVKWLEKFMGRLLAIILVYFVLLLITIGIGWLVVPTLVQQFRAFLDALPTFIQNTRQFLSQYSWLDANTIINSLTSVSGQVGSSLLALPLAIGTFVVDGVLMIFISLYWLYTLPRLNNFVQSLFPRNQRLYVEQVIVRMGETMGGYLRGSVIDGAILGTIKYIGLTIIGVPYAAPLGLLAFTMEFLPTVGAFISALAATLVALTVSTQTALITLAFTILLQQFENHVLVPVVMHSQTDIPALLVIIAVVIGATLGGLLGAIAAIPIAAVLMVLIRDVVAPALRGANQAEPLLMEQIQNNEKREKEEKEGQEK